MAIISILLTLFLFLLPFGVVLRLEIVPSVYAYPTDLVAGLILVFTIYKIVNSKKIYNKELFFPISLFLLVGFISLIISSRFLNITQFLSSFAYLLRFMAYVSVIFCFRFVPKDFLKKLDTKLLVAGALSIIFGFLQFFYYPNLRNLYYLGWDDHLYRLFGTFLDPNFAGAFLTLVFLFLLQKCISTVKTIENTKRAGLYLFTFFTLVAVFLTYSRSAFIMLLVGLIILLLSHKFYKWTVVGAAFVVLLFALFANTKIEGLNPFRVASSEARIQTAAQAFSIVQRNPILGIGFNAYRYAQVRYGLRTESGISTSNADGGTDNSFLFVLATTGILGFIPFMIFWIRAASKYNSPLLTSSVVALLVDSLFINSLFYIFIMGWAFVLIGAATIQSKKR